MKDHKEDLEKCARSVLTRGTARRKRPFTRMEIDT